MNQDRESQIEGLEPKGDSPPKMDAGVIEFKDDMYRHVLFFRSAIFRMFWVETVVLFCDIYI